MTGKMFSFITDTWNPLGGECPHNCKGCWAKDYIKRLKMTKYQGPYKLDAKQLTKKFKDGSVVFVCDMLDLFAANVPMQAIQAIMDVIKAQPGVLFLILTKNPRYAWIMDLPHNVWIGATIETDIDYPELTKAPKPEDRIKAMQDMIAENPDNQRFVCIEPIKKFTKNFADKIISIKPSAVAVGYDNYNNNFPEPSLAETEELITKLSYAGIFVYKKTLRKANDAIQFLRERSEKMSKEEKKLGLTISVLGLVCLLLIIAVITVNQPIQTSPLIVVPNSAYIYCNWQSIQPTWHYTEWLTFANNTGQLLIDNKSVFIASFQNSININSTFWFVNSSNLIFCVNVNLTLAQIRFNGIPIFQIQGIAVDDQRIVQ